MRAKNERDLLDYKYGLENPTGPGTPIAGDTGFEGSILGKNAESNTQYNKIFGKSAGRTQLYSRDYYKKMFGIDIVKADGSLMTKEEFRKAIDKKGTESIITGGINEGFQGQSGTAYKAHESLIRAVNGDLKTKYYRLIDSLAESGIKSNSKVYNPKTGNVYIDITDKINNNDKLKRQMGATEWSAYGTVKLDLMDTAKDVLVDKISSSSASVKEITDVTSNRKGVTIKTINPEKTPIFVKEFPSENKTTDEHRKVLNIQYSPHGKKVLVETIDKDGKPHWYSTEHLTNSSYDPELADLGNKLIKAVDEGKIADANAYKAGIVKLLNETTKGYGAVNLNTTSNSQ